MKGGIYHRTQIDLTYNSNHIEGKLTEGLLKDIHRTLKTNTSDSTKSWFNVGEYKKLPNEVGGEETCLPENVHREISSLLKEYNSKKKKAWMISLTSTNASRLSIHLRT